MQEKQEQKDYNKRSYQPLTGSLEHMFAEMLNALSENRRIRKYDSSPALSGGASFVFGLMKAVSTSETIADCMSLQHP
jgi:hypothetical protein